MAFLALTLDYLVWHFSISLLDFWKVWANLMYFLYHFFAIPIHLKSIFKPLYRLNDTKAEFGIWPLLELRLYNTLMRAVGFVFRLATIIAGMLAMIIHSVLGMTLFIVWFFVPPAILILLVYGFSLVISI